MQHICFIFGHLINPSLSSGGDILMSDIAAAWHRNYPNVRVSVIAPTVGADDFIPLVGAHNVHRIDETPRDVQRLVARPWEMVALFRNRIAPTLEILKRIKPDVVYTAGDFFVNHAPALRYRKMHPRSYWLGAVFHINPPPLQRHNTLAASIASYALQRLSLGWLRQAGDHVYVLNSAVQRELGTMGFDARSISVMGGAIRFDEFPIGDPPEPGTRVLWLNRLHPTKGLDDLPRIWALLPPDVTIDVVGVSAYTESLIEAAKRHGVLDRFRIHGFVSKARRWELMQQANLFVSCSYEEGWGISVCEALGMALPVVTYDLPALREVFGELITLVPVGNVQAFASAVFDQLSAPSTQEMRLTRRAFAQNFDIGVLAARQAEKLFEILDERNRLTIVGIGDVAYPSENQRLPSTVRFIGESYMSHAVVVGPLSASLVRKISPGSKIVPIGSSKVFGSKLAILMEYARRIMRLTRVPLPDSVAVFAVTGELIDVLGAVIVARRTGARLLIALDADIPLQNRTLLRGLYERIVQSIARNMYRYSDLILTQDIAANAKLKAAGLRLHPVADRRAEFDALSSFMKQPRES